MKCEAWMDEHPKPKLSPREQALKDLGYWMGEARKAEDRLQECNLEARAAAGRLEDLQ